jgi:hypothetical protein
MEKRYKYRVGQKIYLYSCLTGSTPNGFAQKLSDLLQVDVEAPDNFVWYNSKEGITGIGGKLPFGKKPRRNPFSWWSGMKTFSPK